MKNLVRACSFLTVIILLLGAASLLSAESRGIEHGQRYDRLVIRNVIVIDGKGTPARGPMDIIVEGNKIAAVSGADVRPDAYKNEKHVLDGTGMYLLPGFINSHVHLQDERAGIPQPFEYEYKVWLSCGITTVRDVGSDVEKDPRRAPQEPGRLHRRARVSIIYMVAAGETPEEGRKAVRAIKEQGGDGDQDLRDGPRHHGGHRRRIEKTRPQGGPPRRGRRDGRPGRRRLRRVHDRALVRHPGRRPQGLPEFPAVLQLQQRKRPVPLGRPPLAGSRSRQARRGSDRDGREGRRLDSDVRHL